VRVSQVPASGFRRALTSDGWDVVQLVPLVARSRLLGLMLLLGHEHSRRDPSDGLLAAIGQQVGVAMENAQLYARAEASGVAAERSRLARELHDSVSQTLFSANLIAGVLPLIWEQDAAEGRARLAELHELTRGALAEMRALLLELRPAALVQAPFGELLGQLAEGLTGRARLPVELRVDPSVAVSDRAKLGLYRIVQEALNNIAKHARASMVWVTLAHQPAPNGDEAAEDTGAAAGARAVLTIRDNGRGFEPTAVPVGHLGLGIMRERAEALGADLRVRSAPAQGTEISLIWVPDP
jgi:signal transduction histidine kinase